MVNKIFKEYMEELNNQEANYKEILSKKKGVVGMKKKILNIATIFIIVTILGVASTHIYAKIQWDIQFKEYQNRQVGEAKGTLQEAKDSGYAEVVDMDYVEQDGIRAKVDSILLTDDCFDANIKFKFDENKLVNSETFAYSYAIYDESKNVYQIFERMHLDSNQKFDRLTLFIYKELGIKYDKNDIYSIQFAESSGLGNIEADEENKIITTNITLRAMDTFPKSKKLYIRIFDLGYTMFDVNSRVAEDFKISDAEWSFEIEVPDKFNERQTIELVPESEIPGLKIEKITLTEAGLVLRFVSESYNNLIEEGKDMEGNEFLETTKNTLNITDGEGKIYQELGGGTTAEENGYKMTIDAGKKDLDKKLYINFNSNGKEYKRELIEK